MTQHEFLQKLRAALTEGEPTFDWNNTDGEDRMRHVRRHAQWAEDVVLRVRDLAGVPRVAETRDVIAEVERRLAAFHSPSFDREIVEELLALAKGDK